jgi:hypothetical protein
MPLHAASVVAPGADLKVMLKRHGTANPTTMRVALTDHPSDAARLLSQIVQPFIGWEDSLDAPGIHLARAYRVSADVEVLEQTRADIFGNTTFLYPLWARPVVAAIEQAEAQMDGTIGRASKLTYLIPHDRVRLFDAALANLMASKPGEERTCLDGMRQMQAYRVNIKLILYRGPSRSH